MNQKDYTTFMRNLYHDIYSLADIKSFNKYFSEDVSLQDPAAQNFKGGSHNYLKLEEMYQRAFPDKKVRIDLLSVADNIVTVCWTMTGTHKGELGRLPASGNKVQITGISVFEFAPSGKIKSIRQMWDRLALLEQINQVRPVEAIH